ncbi:hypothetical protein VN12_06370 [Pirellula sp. SH-Sr6A]|uniref:tape measure protein n=1 Tax=Pirellula sp. SH-Sr6A TaxID=1632865 RepID=UPI00078DBEBC|nr:tape measure protein [Pirellula sp. SH-Sr6A]AMV31727.1 hypothetical protein VN12_06370 [Pirellula sp. SH-Sr6A]
MAAKDIEAGRAHVLLSIRDRMQQGLKVAEKRLRQFGTMMATSGGVIGAGMGAALAWPIKLAANMEQTKTSFAVFLGDANLAEKKLKEIEQLGAETPFTFDQLKDGAQTLLNFGVSADALLPTLRNLGDVSGGDAERFSRLALAFGQVMGKGRLMGQEVNQMIEAGFNPLQEISRITGKSMAKLSEEMEAGQISSRMLATAFASASGPGGRFNGMMQKQSATLTGLFSTLMDNAAIVARALGNAMLPTLKTFTQIGITLSKVITNFVEKNGELFQTIGTVALVVVSVAGAFMGLGAVIMGASFAVGLIGSAIGSLVAVAAFVLSPMGILIGILVGLAVAAYSFRSELAILLAPLIAFIQPAIDALMVLWGIFTSTFNGIVAAMRSGDIEGAAAIAWAGFQALAWTALDSLLGGVWEATGSIGKAILAGRWDLMAAIAMGNVRLTVLKAWNGIKFFWDMAATGMGTVWDGIVWGMRTAFRTMVFGIAQSIVWIGQRFYDLLGYLEPIFEYIGKKDLFNTVRESFNGQGIGNVLSEMQAQAQREDDKAYNASMRRRDAANLSNMGQRAAAEKKLQDELNQYQQEANQAAAEQGLNTLGDKARQAQEALNNALNAANAERERKEASAEQMAGGPQALLAGATGAVKGGAPNSGTFSALGSMLSGLGRNTAMESTAKNTGELVKIAKEKKREEREGMKD